MSDKEDEVHQAFLKGLLAGATLFAGFGLWAVLAQVVPMTGL